jgi:hypothetical protein
MPCTAAGPDYTCTGWKVRAARIRARDGHRCRGCDRHGRDVMLEVHHRRYAFTQTAWWQRLLGLCGRCRLLGVQDEDLVTFCHDCHAAVTTVRRRLYWKRAQWS